MKIALVHDFLFTYGGAERVLSAMHELYPEAPIYTLLAEPEIVQQHFPSATVITSSLQRSPLRRRPQLLLAAMPRAIEEFDLSGYDLVLSSSGAFSHGVITGPDTVHVCYCHSPMRYAWDQHGEYLKQKGIKGPLKLWFALTVMSPIRFWDVISAKRVDIWLANSATVQARIKKFYGQDSAVIYPPVDTEYFEASQAAKQPVRGKAYAVTASRLSSYKRIDLMIAACARLDLPLRIIGDGEDRSRLEKMHMGRATFRGRLSEKEKRDEIAGATCFLFAAEDDFGIAPVEALSLGVPVIAFAQGGATEYVQPGKNGRLFAEQTEESLAAELQALLDHGVSMSPAEIRQTALPYSRQAFNQHIHEVVSHATAA